MRCGAGHVSRAVLERERGRERSRSPDLSPDEMDMAHSRCIIQGSPLCSRQKQPAARSSRNPSMVEEGFEPTQPQWTYLHILFFFFQLVMAPAVCLSDGAWTSHNRISL